MVPISFLCVKDSEDSMMFKKIEDEHEPCNRVGEKSRELVLSLKEKT